MTVGHAEAQGAGHAKHVNDNSSAATDTRKPQPPPRTPLPRPQVPNDSREQVNRSTQQSVVCRTGNPKATNMQLINIFQRDAKPSEPGQAPSTRPSGPGQAPGTGPSGLGQALGTSHSGQR